MTRGAAVVGASVQSLRGCRSAWSAAESAQDAETEHRDLVHEKLLLRVGTFFKTVGRGEAAGPVLIDSSLAVSHSCTLLSCDSCTDFPDFKPQWSSSRKRTGVFSPLFATSRNNRL